MKKKISIVIGCLVIAGLIYLGMHYYPDSNGLSKTPGRIMFGINATQAEIDNANMQDSSSNGAFTQNDASSTSEASTNKEPIYSTAKGAGSTSYPDRFDDRKIIKTGEIQLETLKFTESVIKIQSYIKGVGGYTEISNIQGAGANLKDPAIMRHAEFVFMIPADKFDEFLTKSGDFGYITIQTSSSQDATQEYTDHQVKLKTLKIRENRLLDIMRNAKKLADIISLEEEIQNVSYEIDSLNGDLKRIDKLVKYSTVTVSIQEVAEIKTTAPSKTKSLGERILYSLNQSLNAIYSGFQSLLVIIAALLPFLLILAVIAIPSFFLYRRTKKKE